MINAQEARNKTTKRLQNYVEYEINEAIKLGRLTTKVMAKVEELQFLVKLGYKVETISSNFCKISW